MSRDKTVLRVRVDGLVDEHLVVPHVGVSPWKVSSLSYGSARTGPRSAISTTRRYPAPDDLFWRGSRH